MRTAGQPKGLPALSAASRSPAHGSLHGIATSALPGERFHAIFDRKPRPFALLEPDDARVIFAKTIQKPADHRRGHHRACKPYTQYDCDRHKSLHLAAIRRLI